MCAFRRPRFAARSHVLYDVVRIRQLTGRAFQRPSNRRKGRWSALFDVGDILSTS